MELEELLAKHCEERPAGTPALTRAEAEALLSLTPGWEITDDGKALRMQRRFDGFTSAVEFVASLPELANAEDHHPDVRVFGYRNVEVVFSTHSIGGLSENDFIMAAKLNQQLGQ
jgi:4a-hydroxytetrahydrobiopterin dehydratase